MKFPSLSSLTRCLAATGVFLIGLGTAPIAAHAATYTVKSTADTAGNTCGSSDCTLRQAINAANASAGADSIVFDATVFGASKQTIALSTVLPDVTQDLTITGPSTTGAGVTLQGTASLNIMTVSAGTLSLANLTETGATTASGLSIDVSGTAIVTGCTFFNNRNGISSFGILTVTNSTLATNNSSGLFIGLNHTATINSCTITGNNTGINLNNGDDNPNVTLKNSLSVGNGNSSNNSNVFGTLTDNGNNTKTGTAAAAGLSAAGLADNGGPTQTVALAQGSGAIDTGSTTLTVDQRGITRPQGSAADRGAYEFVPPPQSGPNYVVKSAADTTGTSCGANDCTLRQAIGAANADGPDSTITFDPTVFASAQVITLLNGQLTVSANTTITGTGARKLSISGNNASRVFEVTAGTTTMTGLTITAGKISNLGGGIAVDVSTALSMTDCTVTGNTSTTTEGGGIFSQGALTLTRCAVVNNTANSFAGGITLTIGTSTLTNCTIAGNTATSGGGAGLDINGSAHVTLLNCTVTGNSNQGNGGGINNENSGTLTMGATIVAGNTTTGTSPDMTNAGTFTSNDYNLVGNNTGGPTFTGTHEKIGTAATPINPLLGPVQDNGGSTPTAALLTGSPAIDAANSTLTDDQRGAPRPVDTAGVANVGNGSDIGAFEYVNPNTAPTITSVTITPSSPKTNDTLTANVIANDAEGNSITYTYVWKKNGTAINGEIGSTLDLSKVGNGDKGDQITVTVTANDGQLNSTPVTSSPVTIQNSAPVLAVSITPNTPKTNDTLSVSLDTITDPDGDTVTPTYQWKKNGTNITGATGASLNLATAGNGDRGDKISVVVTGSDGTTSTAVESAQVTIQNSTPVISSVTITPTNPGTNSTLTANVTATDADGDTINKSYIWKKNGTTISGQTGATLDLSVAGNGDKGDQITVTVTADDGINSSAGTTSTAVTVGNTAPSISSVTITPSSPKTNDLLTANVTASDADNDTLTYSYVWKNNGSVLVGETGKTLNLATAANGDKGDQITVTVTANDGTANSTPVTSTAVTVGNTAPSISSVTITPTNPTTNSTLTANVTASDVDNDGLTYSYVWKKNGTVIAGETGSTLNLSVAGNGDKGDVITVTATANDGTASSTPVTSTGVTVGNSAPSISSVTITPANPNTNSTLTANVTSADADGDSRTFTYVWKKNGTTIAGETGSTLNLATAGNGDNGDSITVTVTANDGTTASTPVTSAPVTVGNSAPTITSVTITPNNPTTNSTLTANVVASDVDNDTLTYTYQWKKNGTAISGQVGASLDLSQVGNGSKGDSITVTVTANDGTSDSTPVTSAPVTIGNTAPSISSVTITPTSPKTNDTLTANVVASDADSDSLTYSYAWKKNGTVISGETGSTLDLSKAGNGDDGDSITVTVVVNDGSADSAPVTSNPVTINNLLPVVVSVAPQGASNKVGDKRTFTLVMSDGNGAGDIREMWLLINTTLDWSGGATLIYRPSAGSPTDGLLYLRRGDDFLPPIQIGTGASSSAVLDNGAVRIVGTDVTVSVSGNAITLNLPVTVRDGLVGNNGLFARVQDGAGATDPAAQAGDFGFIRSGTYTVTPQFTGATNSAPTLSDLTPGTTNTRLTAQGLAPGAQSFGFFVQDADGIGDIDSVWFLANKTRGWNNSATFVYYPRTRRLVLRSDDGNSFLGGGQIGSPGTIENSQVKIDLSKVKVTIYPDGKSFGLTLPLQAKTGLVGTNGVWLRVQDIHNATSPDGDDLGFVLKGSWNVKTNTAADTAPNPSNGTS